MPDTPASTVDLFVAELDANVDRLYASEWTYERFTRENGAVWDRIDRAGARDDVLAKLRTRAKRGEVRS